MVVPKNELGRPAGIRPVYDPRTATQRYEVDPLEYNPELRFPESIATYDAMRTQEGHVGSVLEAMALPLTRARWTLNEDGVRPQVTKLVRTELGLNVPGGSLVRRRKEGIVWRDHVAQVVETMCWAGFAPFEQVYLPSAPRPDQTDLGLNEVVHLRKLAMRLPRSIVTIEVGRDGGLKGIRQTNPEDALNDIFIPVDRMVMYVRKREGADWYGRSVLRTAYKNWLMKDIYLRLDGQAAERNSMGIPKISIDDEAKRPMAEEQGRRLRAGAESFVVVDSGTNVELMGVSGSLIDLIPRIEYHDREIARSALAMFLDLGHAGGLGQATLGDTFYNDIFIPSLQATGDYIADVATEHVIRDLVEANFGPDEPYPVMVCGDMRQDRDIAPELLNQLVTAGVINPDPAMEAQFRERYGLPAMPDPDPDAPPAPMDPDEQNIRGQFAQGMIRSGFDPQEALRDAGLNPNLKHLGLLPVTLQPPAAGTNLDNAVRVPPPPGTPPTVGAAVAMSELVHRLEVIMAGDEKVDHGE